MIKRKALSAVLTTMIILIASIWLSVGIFEYSSTLVTYHANQLEPQQTSLNTWIQNHTHGIKQAVTTP